MELTLVNGRLLKKSNWCQCLSNKFSRVSCCYPLSTLLALQSSGSRVELPVFSPTTLINLVKPLSMLTEIYSSHFLKDLTLLTYICSKTS